MKKLYIDCGMGAAGDMLGAALLELMPDPEAVLRELNALGIPGVAFSREIVRKCGIEGSHLTVSINGEVEETDTVPEHKTHSHSGMHAIEQIAASLPVSEKCRADILAVYGLLAEAESRVHGVPVKEIHFHEVGTMDAIADITAVCLLMEKLAPDEVLASPVHVGSGQVRCSHGILPVPAPATAEILKGVPVYGGEIKGELCTPTGAALLKHFVSRFGPMPVLTVRAAGYGMGKKDFERANCVRIMLGEDEDPRDRVSVLTCTLDDMTGEDIGFAMEMLFAGGALDVYTTAIGMKKNRPGTLLTVICRPDDREALARLLFRHTTTIGIRVSDTGRFILDRAFEKRETPFGELTVKKVSAYGISREKYEFEELARIAREKDLSLRELRSELERN